MTIGVLAHNRELTLDKDVVQVRGLPGWGSAGKGTWVARRTHHFWRTGSLILVTLEMVGRHYLLLTIIIRGERRMGAHEW
jgi:hypothetical protein